MMWTYKKAVRNVILSGETFTASPWDWERKSQFGNSTSTITICIQHYTGGYSWCNKEKNGISIAKKEKKLSLFADCMNIYVENPKESTNLEN